MEKEFTILVLSDECATPEAIAEPCDAREAAKIIKAYMEDVIINESYAMGRLTWEEDVNGYVKKIWETACSGGYADESFSFTVSDNGSSAFFKSTDGRHFVSCLIVPAPRRE